MRAAAARAAATCAPHAGRRVLPPPIAVLSHSRSCAPRSDGGGTVGFACCHGGEGGGHVGRAMWSPLPVGRTAACWAHRCLLGAPLPVGALRIGFGAKDLIWHVRDVTRLESRSDQWACGSGCEHGTGSSHHCCMRTRGWGANPTAVRSWTHDTCTSRRCGVKGPLTAVRSPVGPGG